MNSKPSGPLSPWIALAILLCIQFTSAATRPNFVIIMSDDHHYDGYPWNNSNVLAPNPSRLKAEGTIFNHYYVASAVCQPSSYAMFTARYPSRQAAAQWKYGMTYTAFNTRISEDFPSFAKGLTAAGYKTGFVGKVGGYNSSAPKPMKYNNDPVNNQAALEARMATHGFTYGGGLYHGNIGGNVFHNMEWLTKSSLDFLEASKNDPF